jgi:hypothetical protein
MSWNRLAVVGAIALHVFGSSLSGGAVCGDGWRSHSTGRGTCSHHGGVARWVTEDPSADAVKGAAWLLSLGAVVGWLRSAGSSGTSGASGVRPERSGNQCPRCGSSMIVRTRKDKRQFFGCSRYPHCRGSRGYRSRGSCARSTSRRSSRRLPL